MLSRLRLPWPRYREIRIGSRVLRLDMRSSHERRYYDQARRGASDLDMKIWERLGREGDVVLDAGANIGHTALQYLRLGAKRVEAFEPVPHLHARLAELADAGLGVHGCALADSVGESTVTLSRSHDQGHSLNPRFREMFPRVYGRRPKTRTIQVTTLDACAELPAFDYWKIDVEGSEAALLRGARATLERDSRRPRVAQIEVYPEQQDELMEEARRWFSEVERAVVERRTGQLELIAPDGALDTTRYEVNPPVFVFCR